MKIIPHNRPSFDEKELAAATAVIRSRQLVQGARVRLLEKKLAQQMQKNYCIAVSSGTMALTLALLGLNIGPGDEVLIPSYTCSALWHAVKSVDATPVFVDIENYSYNLDPDQVRENITARTKAVIFPHMFGQPGQITALSALCIPLIEDVAQAIGATLLQKPVGAYGDISITSFYATKMIGAGEGGAVLTDSQSIAARIRDLRQYDEQDSLRLRFNAKMTDITANIALTQLNKLPHFMQRRQEIIAEYNPILKDRLLIPKVSADSKPNYFRCIAGFLGDPDTLMNQAQQKGITLRRPIFKPLHLYYEGTRLKNTERAWQSQVSIPLYPDLTRGEIDRIKNYLQKIVDQYG